MGETQSKEGGNSGKSRGKGANNDKRGSNFAAISGDIVSLFREKKEEPTDGMQHPDIEALAQLPQIKPLGDPQNKTIVHQVSPEPLAQICHGVRSHMSEKGNRVLKNQLPILASLDKCERKTLQLSPRILSQKHEMLALQTELKHLSKMSESLHSTLENLRKAVASADELNEVLAKLKDRASSTPSPAPPSSSSSSTSSSSSSASPSAAPAKGAGEGAGKRRRNSFFQFMQQNSPRANNSRSGRPGRSMGGRRAASPTTANGGDRELGQGGGGRRKSAQGGLAVNDKAEL